MNFVFIALICIGIGGVVPNEETKAKVIANLDLMVEQISSVQESLQLPSNDVAKQAELALNIIKARPVEDFTEANEKRWNSYFRIAVFEILRFAAVKDENDAAGEELDNDFKVLSQQADDLADHATICYKAALGLGDQNLIEQLFDIFIQSQKKQLECGAAANSFSTFCKSKDVSDRMAVSEGFAGIKKKIHANLEWIESKKQTLSTALSGQEKELQKLREREGAIFDPKKFTLGDLKLIAEEKRRIIDELKGLLRKIDVGGLSGYIAFAQFHELPPAFSDDPVVHAYAKVDALEKENSFFFSREENNIAAFKKEIANILM